MDAQAPHPKKMSGPQWRAATDRIAAELGIPLAALARRLGYADRQVLDRSRRDGAPAYMVVALRAIAGGAPPLPEEGG